MDRFSTSQGVAFDGCMITFDQGMEPWFVSVACEAVRFWRAGGRASDIVHCRWKSGRVLNMRIQEFI